VFLASRFALSSSRCQARHSAIFTIVTGYSNTRLLELCGRGTVGVTVSGVLLFMLTGQDHMVLISFNESIFAVYLVALKVLKHTL